MKKTIDFPILKKLDKDFKINRNHLRDKYPEVDFKDEDIKKYDYKSHDLHMYIASEFFKQYKINTFGIQHGSGDNYYVNYLTNPKPYSGSLHNDEDKVIITYDELFASYNDGFNIRRFNSFTDYVNKFELPILPDKNDTFKLGKYSWIGKTEKSYILNPVINKENFIQFNIDNILSFIDPEEKIYKHPNGYNYYTKNHMLTKVIALVIKKGNSNMLYKQQGNTCAYDFVLEKYDTVKSYKEYNDGYNIKKMPKSVKEISFEQLKVELIGLCNYIYNNSILVEHVKYNMENLNDIFKNENVVVKYRNIDRRDWTRQEFTKYKKETVDNDYISTCKIYKKDNKNYIGTYVDFYEVDKSIKKELLNYLLKIYGEDLPLNVVEDINDFISVLGLDIINNEEYTREDFLYSETFDIGDYKIKINSSRYIKDQSICDLDVDNFELYKK